MIDWDDHFKNVMCIPKWHDQKTSVSLIHTWRKVLPYSSFTTWIYHTWSQMTIYETVHSSIAGSSFSWQLTIIFLTLCAIVLTKATHSCLNTFKKIKELTRNIIGIIQPIRIHYRNHGAHKNKSLKRLIFRFQLTPLYAHNQDHLAIMWGMVTLNFNVSLEDKGNVNIQSHLIPHSSMYQENEKQFCALHILASISLSQITVFRFFVLQCSIAVTE